MVLPVSMDATWLDGAVSFNGQELRRADSALFAGEGSQPLGVHGGIVRHSDNSLLVTVNVSDVITVQPGAIVIPGNSGVANGVYRAALAAADTATLAARNATNPRIDLVVFRALDTSVVAGHGAYTGRVEVITGTPAASPVAPTLPAMAQELARVTVPNTGGGTATVDLSWREFAAAIGGIIPVATAARLPATPNAKWLQAVAIDTGEEYTWDGTTWLAGAWIAYTPVWTGTTTNPTIGNGTLTGRYSIVGKTVNWQIVLGFGSTTTPGAGRWDFTLPVPATGVSDILSPIGVCNMRDAGTRNYAGLAIYTASNKVHAWRDAGASEAVTTPTTPFTWTNFDYLFFSGSYEAA